MASSAAHSIQGNASLHALHSKSHHKTAQDKAPEGDRFDDVLAQADNAPEPKAAPKAENRKAQKAEKTDKSSQSDQTDAKDDTKTDTARAETGKDAAAKTDDKDGDSKDIAANDDATDPAKTDAAADMLPPVPVQPTVVAQVKTEAGTAEDAAPAAVDANAAPAAQDAAQPAPAQEEGVAQAPAHDFKKALHAANDESPAAKPVDAEIAKGADAPVEVKPSADGNSLTIAAPTAHNPRGVEKFALHTTTEAAPPQATPNVNQFAVEVAAKSQSGAKQFDIRLDPPELGRVEVRLSIDATGKAEAHLTADQPQTLDLLQKDAASLTRALRDAGLNVSQDGLNFSLKNQQSHSDGGERQQGGTRHGFANSNSVETAQQDASAYQRRSLGLLDIRV